MNAATNHPFTRNAGKTETRGPKIRHALVQRIRRELAQGTYLTQARLHGGLDVFIAALLEGEHAGRPRRCGA